MIQQLDKAEGGSARIIIVFIITDSFSTVVCYRVRFYSHGIMVKGVIRGVHYTYLQDQKQWLFIRYVDEQKGENSHQRGSDPTAKTASATFLGTVSSAWHRPNHPAVRGTRNAARNVLTRIIQRNSSTTNRAIELINDRRQQLFIEKKTNRGENGHRCSDGPTAIKTTSLGLEQYARQWALSIARPRPSLCILKHVMQNDQISRTKRLH